MTPEKLLNRIIEQLRSEIETLKAENAILKERLDKTNVKKKRKKPLDLNCNSTDYIKNAPPNDESSFND